MCVRVCGCVCGGVWVPGRVGVSMRSRARSLAYPACKAYAPYRVVICGFSGSTISFDIISQTERLSGKGYLT